MDVRVLAIAAIAGIIAAGTAPQAMGSAQLDARINPDSAESSFEIKYQRTIYIEYPQGGEIASSLHGIGDQISFSAANGDPEVEAFKEQLNRNLISAGSIASISTLDVEYEANFHDNEGQMAVDYKIVLDGILQNFVIVRDEANERSIVDSSWRDLTVDEPVYLQGVNINSPIGAIAYKNADVAAAIQGEARDLLERPLIDATDIYEQPHETWHFLFDPTGINEDASRYGLSSEIAGFVVSKFTMGESSIREGIKTEQEAEATFTFDREYTVKTFESSDSAQISIVGLATRDILDGSEIFGVTPRAPEGYQEGSTGDFPVIIIYGMAALAAIGGIAFFMFSSRSLKKNEGRGQQGIDPSLLTAYKTSSSSGGYQTNRAEAQLTGSHDYQKHRSVYDEQDDSGDDDEQPASTRGAMPKGW